MMYIPHEERSKLMKLYIQNRDAVVELPRDLWVADVCSRGLIVSSNPVKPYIGEYSSVERAREVLREIFEYHRNGKNSYVLPKE